MVTIAKDIDRPDAWTARVKDVAVHPRFAGATGSYDAALLRLSRAAPEGTSTVSPVGPGDEPLWSVGKPAQVIGWGIGNPDGANLQEATLSILFDEECSRACAPGFLIDPDSQICARGDRQSTCYGDSGSPLLVRDSASGQFRQAGIVSFGKSVICNPTVAPEVFTRVAAIYDFVTDSTPCASTGARNAAALHDRLGRRSGRADLALPTALMAVSIAAVSALSTVVWVVACRRGVLDNGSVPAAVFLASVPIAYLVSPAAARLLWILLLATNPVVGTLTARARRREGGSQSTR